MTILHRLLITHLLFLALPVGAATHSDLSIAGTLRPGACNLSLNNGGQVDLGTISAGNLDSDGYTVLPQNRSMTFSIDCDAPLRFAIGSSDQRAGTSHHPDLFGLGMTPTGEVIGGYKIDTAITSDAGGALNAAHSTDNGATWRNNVDGETIQPDRLVGFVRPGTGGSQPPIALQRVTGNLLVHAMISPASAMTLTHEIPLDGLATLELTYL